MKRVLFPLISWLIVLTANSCVAVRYPDDYWEWPEERRSEWREKHQLRPWEKYGEPHERHEEERLEENNNH